ncbi:uroporphyrinogen-III synthase [Christiangramia aquimixticola]|uniref:uroporphyrinogen-III synthase n=1 Tax=Christiangramia aquimixticola TaxID=1697558 RepID=UPI003AA84394
MPSILSTKKLTPAQKELLLNGGLGVVEYDAIKIESRDLSGKPDFVENAIFTSKNAIRAISGKGLKLRNCFCVGETTAQLARTEGFQILETTDNAAELAEKIVEAHQDKKFDFFCGNIRRDELPDILTKNKIDFTEHIVYTTNLNFKTFDSQFDGIMFFSTSGVESFIKNNKLRTTAFCIGETTAQEARKHFEQVIVATKPGIENVIAKVVLHFKKNKHIST